MNFYRNPTRKPPVPCNDEMLAHVNNILSTASHMYGCYVSEIVGPGKRSAVAKARAWAAYRLMHTVIVRRICTGISVSGNKLYRVEARCVQDSGKYPVRCYSAGKWRRCSMKHAAHFLNLHHSTLVRAFQKKKELEASE